MSGLARLPRSIRRHGKQRRFSRRRAMKRVNIPKGIRLRIHHFKKQYFPAAGSVTITGGDYTAASGNLVGPTTAHGVDMTFSIFFQINDLPEVSSFSSLFDEYRINKVVVKFVPLLTDIVSTSLTATAEPTISIQYMTTVIDYDDASTLTSYNAALDYDTFKQSHPKFTHTRTLVPALSNEIYRTGGGTIGYGRKQKQWCDLAYTDIPHYGLKGYTTYSSTHLTQHWKVFVTMYFSMRSTR